jgi:hypothetical protein
MRFACALPECQWARLIQPPENYLDKDEARTAQIKTTMHAAGRVALSRHLSLDHLAIEIYDNYVLALRQRDFPGDTE